MNQDIHIQPIGKVNHREDKTWIDLNEGFEPGLLGLEDFSHIMVVYWFDQNDTPQQRRILQVHPQKDPSKPLTGVFATHSPMRPNLIAVTISRLIAIENRRLYIEEIDALDDSPVLDIKCYIPRSQTEPDVTVAPWVQKHQP